MELCIALKEKLLAKCIEVKQESESQLMAAIAEAQQSANDYGQPKDRYDSFRAQLMRKRDMMAHQLSVLEEELRILLQMRTGHIFDHVELGALVQLNTQTIFIMTGIGKLVMDNETFYVVSPTVPIVEAMKGLKAGDSFNFRGTTMQILKIC